MLPPALLDLLSHRLAASSNVSIPYIQAIGRIRHVQQLATHYSGPSLDSHEIPMLKASRAARSVTRDGSLKRQRQAQSQVQALADLETRVAALKDATIVSRPNDEISEGPHLPEAELRDIYRDLLSFYEVDVHAPQADVAANAQNDQIPDLIQTLEERLPAFEASIDASATQTGLSSQLLARLQAKCDSSSDHESGHTSSSEHSLLPEDGSSLRHLINRLRSVINQMEATWRTEASTPSSVAIHLPFGMLSNTEWRSFLHTCLDANDGLASESVLDLMKRSGLIPSDEQHDAVLNLYATCGSVAEAETFFRRMSISMTRDRQRDLLIKARVKAKRLDDACALIHSLEKQLTPAPMQSYTRVIQSLLSQRAPGSEQHKAQAWDMFSHMRYVAHGTPDEFLYTVMIRACAESADPEPERALDLFREMTVDKNISPTAYTYNAVILTCARSKKFALEAFRLAREMLNSHRDAYGEIPTRLRPDNATFCALLEAAKRIGDLPRARWILTQMTSDARNLREGERPVYIDERVMTHVFHAYASYRPPFRRNAVPYVQGEGTRDSERHGSGLHIDASENHVDVADHSNHPGVPQSHQEIIKEATTLWERMLRDRRDAAASNPSGVSSRHLVFGQVSLTTPLLNAYMAVHYIHSPPSAAYKVYTDLFGSLGLRRDAFTYVLALEAYAHGKHTSKGERQVALSVARVIWKDWRQLEGVGVSQMMNHPGSQTVDARIVERAWSAMMRLLTINDRLDESIDLLHQFVDRYPPLIVKQPSAPDPKRSTRTLLYAERPIVRLTERSTVPEDRIPPLLTFRDLNNLHHRAITAKRPDYVTYITWVAKSYEGALRRRREGTLRPVMPQ